MTRIPAVTLAALLAAVPALAQQREAEPPQGVLQEAPIEPGAMAGTAPESRDVEEEAAAHEADPDLVRMVKERLKDSGYLAGSVDGSFDEAARQAVTRYQEQRALDVTGRLDRETAASLGVLPNLTQEAPSSPPDELEAEMPPPLVEEQPQGR